MNYVKQHDLHFNNNYHAAFILLFNSSLDTVFLVKNKYTKKWSVPGGWIDMKGYGRQINQCIDEKPIMCALKEFYEETENKIPSDMMENKWLWWFVGSWTDIYHETDQGKQMINWKYVVYFTKLQWLEIIMFDEKKIVNKESETSECWWVKISNLNNSNMSLRIQKTIWWIQKLLLEEEQS